MSFTEKPKLQALVTGQGSEVLSVPWKCGAGSEGLGLGTEVKQVRGEERIKLSNVSTAAGLKRSR